MSAKDLSILIPARNEIWLAKTVEDILSNIEMDTEIIVVLDGGWADPAIPQHERVNVVYLPKAIGQRAATNLACKLSKATYVMKTDAHCAFDKGFDRKLIARMEPDCVMVPVMRNLHVFSWKCNKCGSYEDHYQGPTPITGGAKALQACVKCGNKEAGTFEKIVIWNAKERPQSTSYSFDSEPHFQYFNEYKKSNRYRRQLKNGLTESMSIQGSCFLLTRKAYWELNVSDESWGSWGSQGIEVAGKFWLSGGRVLINHDTWYGHLFRTQGGDFGFPYEHNNDGNHKAMARKLFFEGKWDKQVRPLSWLVERFWPITPSGENRGWTQEELNKLKANNN